MLRLDRTARFAVERGPLGRRRHRFRVGGVAAERCLSGRALRAADLLQRERPVALTEAAGRRWWWYRDRFWWDDDGLSAADVAALVAERERSGRRRLERAHAALRLDAEGEARRPSLPRELRLAVWERDGGRCAECGATFELQFDHVIPFALGGATALENLQLLCGECNRRKGASL